MDDQVISNFAEFDFAAAPSIGRGEAGAHRAPLIVADAESLRGYGRIAPNFAQSEVTIVTWPQPGWRPVVPGTGNEGGVVEDVFEMVRRGEVQHAVNHAVGRSYITGWFSDPANASEHRRPERTDRLARAPPSAQPAAGAGLSSAGRRGSRVAPRGANRTWTFAPAEARHRGPRAHHHIPPTWLQTCRRTAAGTIGTMPVQGSTAGVGTGRQSQAPRTGPSTRPTGGAGVQMSSGHAPSAKPSRLVHFAGR